MVQMPLQASHGGDLTPRYDVSPAAMFGDIEYLLGPRAAPWNLKPVIDELEQKLVDFNDDDYLLCMGNPVLMCVAASIALLSNDGRAKMLQWSGKDRKYIEVEVDLR